MPRQLAFLNPLFRLSGDGNVLIEPSQNSLNNNGIKLDFKLNKITNKEQATYTTKMYTQFGNFDVIWLKDAKGSFKVADVRMN